MLFDFATIISQPSLRGQLVRGLVLSSPKGVNPGGLFVRLRGSGTKNMMVMLG
jgi:hypothetical protein